MFSTGYETDFSGGQPDTQAAPLHRHLEATSFDCRATERPRDPSFLQVPHSLFPYLSEVFASRLNCSGIPGPGNGSLADVFPSVILERAALRPLTSRLQAQGPNSRPRRPLVIRSRLWGLRPEHGGETHRTYLRDVS